jgi:hypothetical protein
MEELFSPTLGRCWRRHARQRRAGQADEQGQPYRACRRSGGDVWVGPNQINTASEIDSRSRTLDHEHQRLQATRKACRPNAP